MTKLRLFARPKQNCSNEQQGLCVKKERSRPLASGCRARGALDPDTAADTESATPTARTAPPHVRGASITAHARWPARGLGRTGRGGAGHASQREARGSAEHARGLRAPHGAAIGSPLGFGGRKRKRVCARARFRRTGARVDSLRAGLGHGG